MEEKKKQQTDNACCSSQTEVDEETSCCSTSVIEAVKDPCCSSAKQEEPVASCCSTEQAATAEETATDSFSTTNEHIEEYTVKGMDCPSCAATIEKGLQKTEGIHFVKVNYSTGKLAVGAENDEVYGQIPKHVRKLGFEAESVKQDADLETYKIEGMDCSSCAKTIEKHLGKNSNVTEVHVNFSTGKMNIAHSTTPKEIVKEVQRAGFDATLQSGESSETKKKGSIAFSSTAVSGSLLALGFVGSFTALPSLWVTAFYALAILIGGWKPARSAFYAIKSGSLDMNVLMASAAIGAAIIGEWFEGAMVVWLFALGNTLQNRSIERTRESIRSLMNLAPSEATVKEGDQLVQKAVEHVRIGDVIVVKPGEKVPLDGEIESGESSLNQAPITGESLPVDKTTGDTVYAGTVNESGSLEVRVTKYVKDTTIAKIIHLVEEAQEKRAPTQAFFDKFASIYTPIVFGLAIAVMILPPLVGLGAWGEWFYKGLALLVVACPCALVISTPVAIVSAIGNAAKNGVLIKGGTFLEKAGAVKAMAFDKTGTLTEGKPKVTEVKVAKGSREELVAIATTIEEYSTHPIAQAITSYAEERQIVAKKGEAFKSIAGKGAQATIDGIEYYAGKPKLFQEWSVPFGDMEGELDALQQEGKTLVVVGTRHEILGIIAVADTIRDITVQSIQSLKRVGVNEVVMLTGDNEGTAKRIADETGIDRYFAELLPEDKVTAIQKLQAEGKQVAMIGDGINDAPALATSDLGIAMGGAGTDSAMETADIVLMADNLEKLPHTIRLSRKALSIIKQNIWFSLITKFAALLLIFPGFLTLWMAVLSDTGAALIVILNSMRLMRQK
ncbi:heavy metal translocating P-type ATPase [Pontibacillus salipaludis]|uniref:Cd(2+)-exporting ATPase n=1 Tax=Pontibacillus salipaludis TaxID=1697394 RepID=A0ABQ1Q0M5_9BACI|nr:heavy metal translocating P-type ATPase [Pontibacillus salipaludis]GGD08923.1 copper-translocating P-type ATPase [Pontibacillus salipaludis]